VCVCVCECLNPCFVLYLLGKGSVSIPNTNITTIVNANITTTTTGITTITPINFTTTSAASAVTTTTTTTTTTTSFGSVNRFIDHLQVVNTNNHYNVLISTLQITPHSSLLNLILLAFTW
jgi:hypothetical protein